MSDSGGSRLLAGAARAGGFVLGAAAGAGIFGYAGYRAFVLEAGDGLAGGLGFIFAFVAAVFALAAPFALGKFLGSMAGGRALGELVYGGTFVASFGILVVVATAGLYSLQVYGVSEPFGALVVFDVVTGLSVGGIAGYSLADRVIQRSRAPALSR